MACLNADGTLTASAQAILQALRTPATASEIAQKANLPLFRVRSSLRELVEADLLNEQAGYFQLTATGLTRLQQLPVTAGE